MKHRNVYIGLIILGILVFSLAVFTSLNLRQNQIKEQALQSILNSQSDCIAPCWQGLTPSLSSISELLMQKQNQPTNRFWGWEEYQPSRIQNVYLWEDKENHLIMRGYFESEHLVRLQFLYVNGFHLEDIFQEIGYPNGYEARLFPGLHGELILEALFYFESQGIVLNIFEIIKGDKYLDNSSCFFPLSSLEIRDINLLTPSSQTELRRRMNVNSVAFVANWPEINSDFLRLTTPDCSI